MESVKLNSWLLFLPRILGKYDFDFIFGTSLIRIFKSYPKKKKKQERIGGIVHSLKANGRKTYKENEILFQQICFQDVELVSF